MTMPCRRMWGHHRCSDSSARGNQPRADECPNRPNRCFTSTKSAPEVTVSTVVQVELLFARNWSLALPEVAVCSSALMLPSDLNRRADTPTFQVVASPFEMTIRGPGPRPENPYDWPGESW